LLLDTHIALWAITDSPKLPRQARDLILDPSSEIFVSATTIWEIAIKRSVGRGNMPVSSVEASRYFAEAGYTILPVTAAHAAATEILPLHHTDPFDRLLVAQAMTEPLKLVTHDAKLAEYGEAVLLV
jgi:PIN domain nuclease of toxin-antitoxin system